MRPLGRRRMRDAKRLAVGVILDARPLAAGRASGQAVVLDAPLGFWGGFDPELGEIVDVHHPQCGTSLAGRVTLMPGGRGSSSSSAVLAEALRRGTGPAAIVLARVDGIIALGAIVAAELYGIECPVVSMRDGRLPALVDGAATTVVATGEAGSIELPS